MFILHALSDIYVFILPALSDIYVFILHALSDIYVFILHALSDIYENVELTEEIMSTIQSPWRLWLWSVLWNSQSSLFAMFIQV